jgi:NAD(P) transhydrogenase subunit alpha
MDVSPPPKPSALTVGALTESEPGERRVALDPSASARLIKAGRVVLVEAGAGSAASFTDAMYTEAGATVASRAEVLAGSDVVAVIRPPSDALLPELGQGQTLIGLIDPLNNLAMAQKLADQGVTAVAFEMLPRTISRAQAMDALSSQSNAAGYRAAIVAAEAFGRYLPMMITASGTAVPAKVIVIGTGVAGLQAIATVMRLGAVVTGYDVRSASRGEVESLGAEFLTPTVSDGGGTGGYARAMSAEEQKAQQAELAESLSTFDVIITTAKVPGHTPPLLVSEQTLTKLRPGSVCIDLGSSDKGGNVAGSVEGEKTVTAGGVTVVGAGELASQLPTSASQMYGRNVTAVLASLFPAAELVIDPADEIHQNIVVSHGGEVTNPKVREALKLDPLHRQGALVQVSAA